MLYPLSYGGLSVHAYYTSSFTIEKTQIEEFLVFAVISIAFIAFRRLDEDNKSVDQYVVLKDILGGYRYHEFNQLGLSVYNKLRIFLFLYMPYFRR